MQYLGGKSKWGRKIVDAIQPWREPGALFVDVFCGALNVVRHAPGPRLALDLCQPLVTTLTASLGGWTPPDQVTQEQYAKVKANPDPLDPLTGFVMFGCSFGGKWGGGYAKNPGISYGPLGQNFADMAKRSLQKKALDCHGLMIACLDYRRIPAPSPGTVLYCDPPYRGTTTYSGVPMFDSDHFWMVAAWWVHCGALVFVSEGSGAQPPPGWVVLQEWIRDRRMTQGSGDMLERLYVHESSPMARSLTK